LIEDLDLRSAGDAEFLPRAVRIVQYEFGDYIGETRAGDIQSAVEKMDLFEFLAGANVRDFSGENAAVGILGGPVELQEAANVKGDSTENVGAGRQFGQ